MAALIASREAGSERNHRHREVDRSTAAGRQIWISRVIGRLPEASKLTVDKRDRLAERRAASTSVTH